MKYVKENKQDSVTLSDDEIERELAFIIANSPDESFFVTSSSNRYPGFYRFIVEHQKELKQLGYKVKKNGFFDIVGIDAITLDWRNK